MSRSIRRVFLSYILFSLLSWSLYGQGARHALTGVVCDATSGEPIAYALVALSGQGHKDLVTYADDDGRFAFQSVPAGLYRLQVRYAGLRKEMKVTLQRDLHMRIPFVMGRMLGEVVVTAQEGRHLTSSSTIGRAAIDHLQPSSFSDLTALLPGGKSSIPNMSEVNNLLLRETGTINVQGNKTNNQDYAISSLGTLFMVDGAPLNTDADMQYTASSSGSLLGAGKVNVNRGVDMRTLQTDNIERVEFIRGIPSVEYGNITSGVVLVHRKRQASPVQSRFKVDGYSKLVSVEKGFALTPSQHHILNGDVSYLDAKPDPRVPFETYRRLTGSLRYHGTSSDQAHRWEVSGDYTGSFDKNKIDPDLSYGRTDEYLSDYNRIALTSRYSYTPTERTGGLQRVELTLSAAQQFDYLHQRRLVAPDRMTITPTGVEAGEHPATLIGREYVADYVSDGKPLTLFAKGQTLYNIEWGKASHRLKAGFNYDLSKNFGRGQVYDLSYPLFPKAWDTRPRPYYQIPALQQLALYAEDLYTQPLGAHTLQLEAGVRLSMLLGLAPQYTLSYKPYLDPRVNLRWSLPAWELLARDLKLSLDAGWGLTTRMPTLNYLYPDPRYVDITQLAYYDINAPYERSLYYVRTYIEDATNYKLRATRNQKLDLRLSAEWGRNRISVSYFNELMTTGFRYRSTAQVYSYNKYDASAIDYTQLTGQPDISTIPYTPAARIESTSRPENGSKIRKEGVELQLMTERIPVINTSLILGGAWFRSTYSNSVPLYYAVSGVYGNVILSDQYLGLYNWQDGSENQSLSTNLLFDTQIPQWGLILTTAIESTWLVSRRRLPQDGRPIAYLDVHDGKLHPYTDESERDTYLQHLFIRYSDTLFKPSRIPLALGVNLKVSKQLGKLFTLSLFANNVIDYLPDYKVGTATLRRTATPYFGMELRIKI